MVEQRGKILKVPPGQQFALKTFHDYVWNRGADGQPTSWVINITGKKAKETTIQMRFGKENDWKSGQVYLFFTRFLPPECLKDVRRCLKKERIGPILKKLRDKEASNPSTTLSTNVVFPVPVTPTLFFLHEIRTPGGDYEPVRFDPKLRERNV